MKRVFALVTVLSLGIAASPVAAEDRQVFPEGSGSAHSWAELPAYIQCAPYARKVSGIQLFGEAKDWWAQAQGRYVTGKAPQAGAVIAFAPARSMRSGHVAMVSKVLDSRRVLLDHANWSPINGRRGQVEKDVLAVDVSPAGDWSMVRVWYAPLGDLGTTPWPVTGFIYAGKAAPVVPAPQIAQPAAPSAEFERAFAAFE